MDTTLVRAWYSWCGKTIRVLVDTALVRAWYSWCGKTIRVAVVRKEVCWSEFRCWNHVESSWGSKSFLWFFRFPEFLDCRSHELAYRAHSTFRPVPAEQGLNNTTYLFSPEVTSSPTVPTPASQSVDESTCKLPPKYTETDSGQNPNCSTLSPVLRRTEKYV